MQLKWYQTLTLSALFLSSVVVAPPPPPLQPDPAEGITRFQAHEKSGPHDDSTMHQKVTDAWDPMRKKASANDPSKVPNMVGAFNNGDSTSISSSQYGDKKDVQKQHHPETQAALKKTSDNVKNLKGEEIRKKPKGQWTSDDHKWMEKVDSPNDLTDKSATKCAEPGCLDTFFQNNPGKTADNLKGGKMATFGETGPKDNKVTKLTPGCKAGGPGVYGCSDIAIANEYDDCTKNSKRSAKFRRNGKACPIKPKTGKPAKSAPSKSKDSKVPQEKVSEASRKHNGNPATPAKPAALTPQGQTPPPEPAAPASQKPKSPAKPAAPSPQKHAAPAAAAPKPKPAAPASKPAAPAGKPAAPANKQAAPANKPAAPAAKPAAPAVKAPAPKPKPAAPKPAAAKKGGKARKRRIDIEALRKAYLEN